MTKKRRYHTAICAIAKDEDRYLLEWIAYHLSIGFEHIFLYDNMSQRRIARLINDRYRKKITIIRWPNRHGRHSQLEAYEHFLWAHGGECEWAAVLDIDEMLHLKQHNTIDEFLAMFPDVTGIALNWRIFGSAGHRTYKRAFLMERFTRASQIDFQINRTVKSIHRMRYVALLGEHHANYMDEVRVVTASGRRVSNGPYVDISADDFDVAQVNHYFVKSQEEWEIKIGRRGYEWGEVRSADMFHEYDRNEVVDTSILRRKARTRKLAARIAFLPRDTIVDLLARWARSVSRMRWARNGW
ncbi:Glycosyl transferase family 2 [Methylorubrum aminovorans]